VQFKVAMLEILAKHPDGRATLDELSYEMEMAADGQEAAARFSEHDFVDVFQSGLVVLEGDEMQITDAGRSALRALDDLDQSVKFHAPTSMPLSAPSSFLTRVLGSRAPRRTASRRTNLSASIASGLARLGGILRGHLEQDVSGFKRKDRAAGVRGALLAGLSLLVIILGVGALIAINQIKSLKTEIATLERAIAMKKQAPKPESIESKKDDQRDDRGKAGADKGSGTAQSAAFSALNLSPEEIHLIRDYIKPVPFAGPATLPSITVGDSVTTGTIPLPSPLTDKIPKLLGGRFAIRNGAIVIVKRDSHQADAVLPPN
jgi:hypothetical protein